MINGLEPNTSSYGASQMALVVKNLPTDAAGARDVGSIPGWEYPLGVGNGNPLQYSCLENSMDKRSLAGYSLWGCRVWHDQAHTYIVHTISRFGFENEVLMNNRV